MEWHRTVCVIPTPQAMLRWKFHTQTLAMLRISVQLGNRLASDKITDRVPKEIEADINTLTGNLAGLFGVAEMARAQARRIRPRMSRAAHCSPSERAPLAPLQHSSPPPGTARRPTSREGRAAVSAASPLRHPRVDDAVATRGRRTCMALPCRTSRLRPAAARRTRRP